MNFVTSQEWSLFCFQQLKSRRDQKHKPASSLLDAGDEMIYILNIPPDFK